MNPKEGDYRPSEEYIGCSEVFIDGQWTPIRNPYPDIRVEPPTVKDLHTALKAKMTGQVINGVMVACLLGSELEEVYAQFKGD